MDEVTLGELARRMDSIHTDVKELRASIVDHNDLSTVAASWQSALQAHEARANLIFTQHEAALKELQAWQTWAMRLILGAVLLAIIGGVLVANPGQ